MVEYDSHSGEIKQSSVPTNASDDLERELTKDNLKIEQTSSKGGTLKDKIACLGTLGQGCHKIEGEYKEIYSKIVKEVRNIPELDSENFEIFITSLEKDLNLKLREMVSYKNLYEAMNKFRSEVINTVIQRYQWFQVIKK